MRDGDEYVINGRKWWTSGIGDPRCKMLIFMGKTDPDSADRHKQQSMILVPRDTPGVKSCACSTSSAMTMRRTGMARCCSRTCACRRRICSSARGAASRSRRAASGPGRIHHCMRLIGVAERALELMCRRARERVAFGKPLAINDVTQERIAQARIEIDQARLLVLHAAWMMDTVGNKAAQQAIADDQSRRSRDDGPRHGLGDPVVWRGGRQPGLSARLSRRDRADDAHPRRAG